MKPLSFLILLYASILSATAQSAYEEIQAHPAYAAGKYYAYQAPGIPSSPAPEGYSPFYISMFARHGSRYLTKKNKYDEPLALLEKANREGKLTDDGKRALQRIRELAKEAQSRYGELTPKGVRQHQELIRRIYAGYPQIFKDGTHIDARSTYKTRAFLSMAAACIELKGLNPELVITTDASEHDAYYMKYKNKTYEAMHLAGADSIYQQANRIYVHPERLMKQLFTAPEIIKDPIKLATDLFELNGICQSSDNQEDLSFLFTEQERYDLWQRNNFEWYYEKGPSPLSGACMYKLEKNLLNNFIETADTVISSNKNAATLRYGHDTNLAPLAVLMGIDQLTASTGNRQEIARTYRTYRIIPMCGNIQAVFYKNSQSNDILVKVLLNERECRFPVTAFQGSYYRWKDLRAYWKKLADGITLPPDNNP